MNTPLHATTAAAVDVRQTLRRLFLIALVLRVAVALLIHATVSEEVFAPDQQTYHAFGKFLADRWSLDLPPLPGDGLRQGPKGYIYVVATVYYAFGAHSILPKLLNCLLGALTVLAVFAVAVRMGATPLAAVRAATYTAWFPSLVLWSTQNIRDVWIVLLILLICRQALVLQARPGPLSLFLLGGWIWALVQFRSYVLFAVAGPVVVSFLAQRSRHIGRNLVIGSLAAAAVIYADQEAGADRKARFIDLEQLNEIRFWNTTTAASAFEQADISTPGKALAFLPKGLAYFLLAPFPWMVGSIRQILALPEMLFFYSLIPSIFRGVRHLARSHLRTSLMALLITAGLTLGYSLGEGNAGTAYRHRAQLLCFFLIFAGVGRDIRQPQPISLSVPRATSA
jgi:hypothetical protein